PRLSINSICHCMTPWIASTSATCLCMVLIITSWANFLPRRQQALGRWTVRQQYANSLAFQSGTRTILLGGLGGVVTTTRTWISLHDCSRFLTLRLLLTRPTTWQGGI